MASERPKRRRATRAKAAPTSASAAGSAPGDGSGRGPGTRLSKMILRMGLYLPLSSRAKRGVSKGALRWCDLQVMAGVRAVERFVAEREVGNDVALDRSLEQRPLEPRRVAQVAALDPAIAAQPQPDQDVAAEAFDESRAFASRAGCRRELVGDIPLGQPIEDLLDERQALLDFANPDPHPRVDVASFEHRNLE